MRVIAFLVLLCAFGALLASVEAGKQKIRFLEEPFGNVDHCSNYTSCPTCIAHEFCGWCSTPVIYQNGAKGYQCAGFNPGGPTNSTSNPFVCNGVYSTEQCVAGYNCNATSKMCVLALPGDGEPFASCNATCNPNSGGNGNGTAAPTYICTNNTCQKTTPGHGTSLEVCQQSCGHTPPATNGTPNALIGVWRGLQINSGYQQGEWQLEFNEATVLVRPPVGSIYMADVGTSGAYLVFNFTTGPEAGFTVYILWQLSYGPTTVWVAFAAGAPGGPPPSDYDIAMTAQGYDEFVFVHCIDPTNCNFTWEGGNQYASFSNDGSGSDSGSHTDHCTPFPNCTICLEQPYCGWCSTPVIYHDGTVGAQCAGFNDNNTSDPFKCFGTYSTEECPTNPIAPTYTCNNATKTCDKAKPGVGTSLYVCNQTCGQPPPPPPPPPAQTFVCIQANQTCVPAPVGHGASLLVCNQTCTAANNNGTGNGTHAAQTYICNNLNRTCEKAQAGVGTSLLVCNQTCGQVTPPPAILNGVWRGIQVNNDYTFGEWDAKFANTSVTISDPSGTIHTAQVSMDSGGDLQFIFDGENVVVFGQFQIMYGPETLYLTLALSADNAQVAPSFITAMNTPGETEFNFIRCNDGSTNCVFSF